MHQKDYRGEQISRGFIYNMSMMGNSEFCSVFPEVKWLCIFWDVVFFELYILALYLKPSIYPQLNAPTCKKDTENSAFHIKLLKYHE